MTICSSPLAGFILFLPFAASGQPPAPAFDAASIKPSNPDAHGSTYGFAPGGGLNVKNGTLKGIIEMAYDVRDFQISGGPGWVSTELYDITAKTALDDLHSQPADQLDRRAEIRLRLQVLLAQRFQLKVHSETKELPVYVLVAAKNGSKLVGVANPEDSKASGIRSGCGQMTGTRASMAVLAITLSNQVSHPVREQTGLTGRYNFQLDWTPDAGPCSQPTAGAPDGPSLFTALQEQLGLRLEATKGPVELVVIDHAERADAN
jgi:bla regulator protein blaR1